jgi:hypothetical protein
VYPPFDHRAMAGEFWPEIIVCIQLDSHLPVSKLLALNAILSLYF